MDDTRQSTATHTTDPKRTRRHRSVRAAIGVLALTGVTAGGATIATASDSSRSDRHRTLEVDVAENGLRFAFDEAPVHADGMPAYGNPFVTQGYLYPAGTLDGTDGVNDDGSPEFPEEVIGEWSCKGYYIADGAHTTEGSWVFTTQLFAFGNDGNGHQPDTGTDTIVLTGYEGAEVGEEVTTAITGGTGRYATARGEADQELLGFNNAELPTMGIDKTVTFQLERK